MKLFNSSLGRLVPSDLVFTEAEALQLKSFIEVILFFSVKEKLTAHEYVARPFW